MGEYLFYAKECVKHFKPIIEQKTGIKLEGIIIKEASKHPKFDLDYGHLYNARMFVSSEYPNTIFVNEEVYGKVGNPVRAIPIGAVHEITHLIHPKLIEKKTREANIRADLTRLFKRHRKSVSFGEGFAKYMSLNHLKDTYDNWTLQEVLKDIEFYGSYHNHFLPRHRPYERGYKFFRKVLSVLGKDKVFEVAKSPPISELEVKMPLLYLLRRYPLQGVKNIPKFLTRSIKTKILKKKYGYAPFDFVEKGSGKGKVVKALPA